MGVDVTDKRDTHTEIVDERATDVTAPQPARTGIGGIIGEAIDNIRVGFRELQWRYVLLFGVVAGLLMPSSLLQNGALSFIAGIVPVGAGLLIGRKAKAHYGVHGFMTGLVGALVGLTLLVVLLLFTPFGTSFSQQQIAAGLAPELAQPQNFLIQFGGLTVFSLLMFCTFGATMAGRTEERQRTVRAQVGERGGQLERASTIRTLEDIRGLSLPQFGWYVNNFFKKNNFTMQNYKFLDKDKHLDMWLEHNGEPWHLRLSVADKISPGTVEGLLQEMKREGTRKGIVLASTEFLPSAQKSAKGRPVILIDGNTLFEIAEK